MKTVLAFVLVAMVIFSVVEDGDCFKRIFRRRHIRRPKAPRNNRDCRLNKRSRPATTLVDEDVEKRGKRLEKYRIKCVYLHSFCSFLSCISFYRKPKLYSEGKAKSFQTKVLRSLIKCYCSAGISWLVHEKC